MKVLVTGAEGFIGGHMMAYLIKHRIEVFASTFGTLPGREFPEGIVQWPCDITDPTAVGMVIKEADPNVIIHLAGQAFVQRSFEDPLTTFSVNATGTLNLLEAVRKHAPKAAVVLAGSGTEYGAAVRVPTPESTPLRPTSPYAASKVAAEVLCSQYYEAHGIRAMTARLFGTTGPGKTGDFINDVATQIIQREVSGSTDPIEVGDIRMRRDIMDIRDAVEAFYVIARHGSGGKAYNVGSGQAYLIADLLLMLLGEAKTSKTLKTTSVKELIRDADEPVHWGDTTAIRELGWRPKHTIQETIASVLEARRKIAVPA